MSFSAQAVKDLRDHTGAGMMDCKKALQETDGDFEKAVSWLREKGIADASKREGKTATEGAVASYIHMGGKIGVLVEVNCESDFVARGDEFQNLCRDICLQICSAAPQYVSRDEVPQAVVDKEMEINRNRAREMGKPDKMLDKIAEGMLNKWFQEVCLLEQKFVKDPEKTIEEVVKELSGKVGEKIEIRRFVRYQLGEGKEKESSNLAEEVAQALDESKGA